MLHAVVVNLQDNLHQYLPAKVAFTTDITLGRKRESSLPATDLVFARERSENWLNNYLWVGEGPKADEITEVGQTNTIIATTKNLSSHCSLGCSPIIVPVYLSARTKWTLHPTLTPWELSHLHGPLHAATVVS